MGVVVESPLCLHTFDTGHDPALASAPNCGELTPSTSGGNQQPGDPLLHVDRPMLFLLSAKRGLEIENVIERANEIGETVVGCPRPLGHLGDPVEHASCTCCTRPSSPRTSTHRSADRREISRQCPRLDTDTAISGPSRCHERMSQIVRASAVVSTRLRGEATEHARPAQRWWFGTRLLPTLVEPASCTFGQF